MELSTKKNDGRQEGFTIVELLIATAVFSVILLGASFAMIQVSRMYYKGIILSKTQETARNVADSISRPIQLDKDGYNSGSATFGTITVSAFCVGSQRYSYVLDKQKNGSGPDGSPYVLVRDTVSYGGICDPLNLTDSALNLSGLNNAQELIGDKMRLKSLSVTQPNPANSLVININVGVLYGDGDLIERDGSGNPVGCRGGIAGSQWCALAEYSTTVTRR